MSNARAATPNDSQTDALLGRLIDGKYRLDARIGEGATGVVYEARQMALGVRVAIKVLHRGLQSRLAFVSRFHVEARAASAIAHEHTTRVLDFGVDPASGILYICTEYLEGETLATLLRAGNALAPARVVDITLQVLGALGAAHQLGILHRDLRPQHVVVQQRVNDDARTRDFVKVSDFGIAPLEHGAVVSTAGASLDRLSARASEYLSPEQALGGTLDARSDIYAVGVILSQLLTGRSPFATGSGARLRIKVDPELEAIGRRAMSPAPSNRYGSTRQMRAALQDTSVFRALMAPHWPAEVPSAGLSVPASFEHAEPSRPSHELHVATPFVAIPLAERSAALSDGMATRRPPPPVPARAPALVKPSLPPTLPPPANASSLEPTYCTLTVDDPAAEVRSRRAPTMVSAWRADLTAKRTRGAALRVAAGGLVAGLLALTMGWRHLNAPMVATTGSDLPLATAASTAGVPVAAGQLPPLVRETAPPRATLGLAPLSVPALSPPATPKQTTLSPPNAGAAPPVVKLLAPAPLANAAAAASAAPVAIAAPPPPPTLAHALQAASTPAIASARSAPAARAPTAAAFNPDAARVELLSTQSERVNARAVNDALRHVNVQRCYVDALRRAGAGRSASGGTATLALSIDESRVTSSDLRGVDLPGLSSCVSGQLANARVASADMGGATATVTLRFSSQ